MQNLNVPLIKNELNKFHPVTLTSQNESCSLLRTPVPNQRQENEIDLYVHYAKLQTSSIGCQETRWYVEKKRRRTNYGYFKLLRT